MPSNVCCTQARHIPSNVSFSQLAHINSNVSLIQVTLIPKSLRRLLVLYLSAQDQAQVDLTEATIYKGYGPIIFEPRGLSL